MKFISLFLLVLTLNLSAQSIIIPGSDDIIRYGGGNNNSDDLLSRYKRDLIPTKLKFENSQTFQKIIITVKNFGNLRFEGEGARTVAVTINDKTLPALLNLPIEASESSMLVIFSTDPLLSHCEVAKIEIDTDHNALQMGHGVFQNDSATLEAFEMGQIPLCL